MIISAILLALVLAAGVALFHASKRAPLGHEDQEGFYEEGSEQLSHRVSLEVQAHCEPPNSHWAA
jgi:hypothetical protein